MHPDGETRVFMAGQTLMFGVMLGTRPCEMIKIGYVGGDALLLGRTEWRAFVELVNEIDKEFSK